MLFSGCSKKNKDTHYFYSEKELDKLEDYISESYGKIEYVLHEIASPDIHLDVMVIEPTEEQPYYKLVTMGAGAYKMNVPKKLKSYNLERAEYVIFLPKDWDIESKTDEGYWPIGNLKMVGRLALNTDSWLGDHTARRRTVAHKAVRLMLLGSPPDMVHDALSHRTHTPYGQTKVTLLTTLILY